MCRRLNLLVILALIVVAFTWAGATHADFSAGGDASPGKPGPAAIMLPSAEAGFVLSSDGSVQSFNPAADTLQPRSVFQFHRTYTVIDGAAATPPGAATLLCFTVRRVTQAGANSWVSLWRPNDRTTRDIPLSGGDTYTAVALAPDASVAYVANATMSEIYGITLNAPRSRVEFIVGIPGATRIGAIAVDAAARRLFVSDVDDARVFEVNLARRTVAPILDIKGSEIHAMTYDPSKRRLYLADASNETVWVADMNATVPTARTFARHPSFETPNGVALDQQSRVWVCDQRARKLFRFSLDGEHAEITREW